MSTVECQFCGARLILPEGDLPPEVRCKRCGRRVEIKQARRTASTPTRPLRPSEVRPAQTVRATQPPRFESLPKEAPRVHAYPTQTPPPLPIRAARNSNPWKLTGLAAAAVLGLAVTVVAVQQAMHRRGNDAGPKTSPPHASVKVASTTAPAGKSAAGNPTPETQPDQGKSSKKIVAPSVAQADSMRGTTGLAKQIDAEAHFNSTVYANSEIALREIERARLQLPESDQSDWFEKAFEPPYEGEALDALKWVIWSKFASRTEWLFETRPVFSVYLKHAPN